MGKNPSLEALLRVFAQRLLHHLVALVAALAPYVVQWSTNKLGWQDTVATSAGIVVVWLLGNAHVQGRLVTTIGSDVVKGLGQLLSGDGIGQVLGGLLGGGGTGATVAVPATLGVHLPDIPGVTSPSVAVPLDALKKVVSGGAADQADLDDAVNRLNAAASAPSGIPGVAAQEPLTPTIPAHPGTV